MKIINMTPHELNIRREDRTFVNVPAPSKAAVEADPNLIARCATQRTLIGEQDGIGIYETRFGAPSPLPSEEADTIYVVSAIYLAGLRAADQDRGDVFVPGEAIRDDAGRVVGCVGLSC